MKLLRGYGVGETGVVSIRISGLQIQPTAVELKQCVQNQVIRLDALRRFHL